MFVFVSRLLCPHPTTPPHSHTHQSPQYSFLCRSKFLSRFQIFCGKCWSSHPFASVRSFFFFFTPTTPSLLMFSPPLSCLWALWWGGWMWTPGWLGHVPLLSIGHSGDTQLNGGDTSELIASIWMKPCDSSLVRKGTHKVNCPAPEC